MKNIDFLHYLSDKLDALDQRLDDMNQILAVQQEQLREHMRRTELNEAAIAEQREKLAPVLLDQVRLRFLGKVIAAAIPVAGAVYYTLKVIKGG